MNKFKIIPLALWLVLFAVSCEQQQSSPPLSGNGKSITAVQLAKSSWKIDKTSQAGLDDELIRRNFMVVLDGSGSMSEHGCSGNKRKIDAAKIALQQFSTKLNLQDNLGLLPFDSRSDNQVRVPLGHGDQNRKDFINQVNIVEASSGTPLRTAITVAFRELERQAQRQLGYGEYNLVVVTDGAADLGEDPSSIVNQMLNSSPVILHTIGFCINAGHSLNQPGLTIYRAANNPQELQSGLDSVLAESETFVNDIKFQE